MYLASVDRPYAGDEGEFDIRKQVTYPQAPPVIFDPILNVSNKKLTSDRCLWCHECGFSAAWDGDHVGMKDWHPRYRARGWQPIVQRMAVMDGAMLNEEIADRIYSYLYQESTGTYDEAKDPQGATIVHVDQAGVPHVVDSPSSAAARRGTQPNTTGH